MENPPSKFASWSLVASALILAFGLVAAASLLHTRRTPVAEPPQVAAPAPYEPLPEGWLRMPATTFTNLMSTRVRMGYRYRELGLTFEEATNHAHLMLCGSNPPPFDLPELARRRLAKDR